MVVVVGGPAGVVVVETLGEVAKHLEARGCSYIGGWGSVTCAHMALRVGGTVWRGMEVWLKIPNGLSGLLIGGVLAALFYDP